MKNQKEKHDMTKGQHFLLKWISISILLLFSVMPLTGCSSAGETVETVQEGVSDILKIAYGTKKKEEPIKNSETVSSELQGPLNGTGYVELDTGVAFQGEFVDGEPADGTEGSLIIPGIGSYTGNFENRKRNGYGQFFWEDGASYAGSWKDDKMNGEGKLTLADGTVYTGTFSANNLNGDVTINFSNNDNYTGSVQNYKKTGKGIYTWADGAVYDGQWFDDKMNSSGTYYYHGKSYNERLVGTFKDNKPNGTLKYYTKNGTSYSTTWQNGKCTKVEAN